MDSIPCSTHVVPLSGTAAEALGPELMWSAVLNGHGPDSSTRPDRQRVAAALKGSDRS